MGQKTSPPPDESENNILTPKAPSIAFPLANPAVAPEPQVNINVSINTAADVVCLQGFWCKLDFFFFGNTNYNCVCLFSSVEPLVLKKNCLLPPRRRERKKGLRPDSSSPPSALRSVLIIVTSSRSWVSRSTN